MRPIPIPKETAEHGARHGWQTKVISGPDGDLTGDIRPVDALVGAVMTEQGPSVYYNILIQIEDEDWQLINEHGRFWLTFTGSVVPFSLSAWDPSDTGEEDDRSDP